MSTDDLSVRVLAAIEAHYPEERQREITELVKMCCPGLSDINLEKARYSALMLAGGNVEKLVEYLESIEADFRDVIYWYSQGGNDV